MTAIILLAGINGLVRNGSLTPFMAVNRLQPDTGNVLINVGTCVCTGVENKTAFTGASGQILELILTTFLFVC